MREGRWLADESRDICGCVVGNKRVSGARVPIKSDPFFNFFFFLNFDWDVT